MNSLRRLLGVMIFLLIGTAVSEAQGPQEISLHLDSENPVLLAQSIQRLESLDRSAIGILAQALEANLAPIARARLEMKLDSLLRGVLAELDTVALELDELRRNPASAESMVERSLTRIRIREKFNSLIDLLRMGGPFLASSLSWHSENREASSELLHRIRSRLRGDLLSDWKTNQKEWDAAKLDTSDLRWLSSSAADAVGIFPQKFMKEVFDRSCHEAWEDLCSFNPVLERRGRRYLLDIGEAALDFLDSKRLKPEDTDPPTEIIDEWRMRTTLRLSPEWDDSHAVALANWELLPASARIDTLLRLKAVLGSKISPTLYHVATTASDPVLRRRSAEFLSLLGDSRGAQILLIERRFGSERLEAASRDAIMRAATLLRDSNQLDGARLLLEELVERLPHDSSVRHALGLVLLRERKLERAIREFLRSIDLDPTRSTAHYNLACAYALNGQTENALDSLAESIRHGYDRFDHAKTDPDLESLRDDPRFKELISSSN
ncbi:MAG: hypothetical protein CBC13_07525 [Planctomycetia bacterium TMED53]|nr:MAG: hypothetical protein CBC13_07525 [Planctomycetia bacterium TMED53]